MNELVNRLNAQVRPMDGPPRSPRDAATLIVLRRDGGDMRLLMGRRHERHKFMPGKFVFPGGAVDPADSRVAPLSELDPGVEAKLMARMRGRASAGRARGLAMAALRETFEEAGLIIGERADRPARSRAPGWRDYLATGVRPTLHNVRLVTRAITPPGRPRRYDTRFFVIDADAIQGDLHDLSGAGDELLDLHWLTFAEAQRRDLPQITSTVLTELERRIASEGTLKAEAAVPFYYMRHGRFCRDEI